MDRKNENETAQNMQRAEEKNRFYMEVESRSQNEEFARVVVAVFMSRMDPTLEEVDDVKTAVSEAVTNAVIHGYRNGSGIIYIESEIEGKELTVSVKDTGAGIPDIEKAMEPMYTTEAFMDQVQVQSRPGEGTVVIMKKQIGR